MNKRCKKLQQANTTTLELLVSDHFNHERHTIHTLITWNNRVRRHLYSSRRRIRCRVDTKYGKWFAENRWSMCACIRIHGPKQTKRMERMWNVSFRFVEWRIYRPSAHTHNTYAHAMLHASWGLRKKWFARTFSITHIYTQTHIRGVCVCVCFCVYAMGVWYKCGEKRPNYSLPLTNEMSTAETYSLAPLTMSAHECVCV